MSAAAALPWAQWLPAQRWFAGRGRQLDSARVVLEVPVGDDVELVLIDARYADGSSERYQVVVQWDSVPPPDHSTIAKIGESGGRTGYDAVYQPDPAGALLSLVEWEPGAGVPGGVGARVVTAEQSNTSVVFGERAILKLFRRVAPGVNPEIELGRVLGRAGNPHVARVLGTLGVDIDDQRWPLGMVTEYAANGTDGWEMATASARQGGDFAGEAHRLGQAVASVHTALAGEFGTAEGRVPVHAMRERLAVAAAAVPELAGCRAAIADRFAALAVAPVVLQRVHGDLHLGQVLRTADTWLVIDFEGEPGQPLERRRAPDSPLRDVAGMLRSFCYAAHHSPTGSGAGDDRAREWVARSRSAFCAGYAEESGVDPRAQADVLAAYELDKAVYEAVYEARHRPGWLSIPLDGIARLLG